MCSDIFQRQRTKAILSTAASVTVKTHIHLIREGHFTNGDSKILFQITRMQKKPKEKEKEEKYFSPVACMLRDARKSRLCRRSNLATEY